MHDVRDGVEDCGLLAWRFLHGFLSCANRNDRWQESPDIRGSLPSIPCASAFHCDWMLDRDVQKCPDKTKQIPSPNNVPSMQKITACVARLPWVLQPRPSTQACGSCRKSSIHCICLSNLVPQYFPSDLYWDIEGCWCAHLLQHRWNISVLHKRCRWYSHQLEPRLPVWWFFLCIYIDAVDGMAVFSLLQAASYFAWDALMDVMACCLCFAL